MNLITKTLMILAFFIFMPSFLIADQVENELPKGTSSQVKEKARQVIALGIENKSVIKMTKTMLQNKFSDKEILSAYNFLLEAKNNNFPEIPIINKLHEGIGKHVDNEKIIMAMAKVKNRYKTANKIAKNMARDSVQLKIMIRDIAESMSAGMTVDDISKLSAIVKARTEDQTGKEAGKLAEQTYKTVKTMARLGVDSESAAEVTREAIQMGYGPDQLDQLKKAFIFQARTMSNPSLLAKSFNRSIRAGASINDLSNPDYIYSGNRMGNKISDDGPGDFNGSSGQGNSMGSGSGEGGSGSGGTGRGGSGSGTGGTGRRGSGSGGGGGRGN